jgi:hypothetical protein
MSDRLPVSVPSPDKPPFFWAPVTGKALQPASAGGFHLRKMRRQLGALMSNHSKTQLN